MDGRQVTPGSSPGDVGAASNGPVVRDAGTDLPQAQLLTLSLLRMVLVTCAWCASLYLVLLAADAGGWVRFGTGLLVAVVGTVALLFTLADLEDAEVRL